MSDCIFCKILAKEIPADLVYEDEYCIAFKDINPVSPTHFLIIPRKHISCIADLESADCDLVGHLMLAASKIARTEDIEDYRLVINNGRNVGQTVFHIHVHLLSGRSFSWPPG